MNVIGESVEVFTGVDESVRIESILRLFRWNRDCKCNDKLNLSRQIVAENNLLQSQHNQVQRNQEPGRPQLWSLIRGDLLLSVLSAA